MSLLPPLKFAIRTWFCNCPQYLCLCHIVVECSPSIHDLGKMLVLTNRLLCWAVFTSDQDFVFPANFMSSTYTDKNNPFSRWTKRHSQFGISPIHVSIGFSQIAFPTIVLPKDDRINSFQEERLGLPYWTMILAICVVLDESKCLDTSILEFSIICEHLPFFTWVWAITNEEDKSLFTYEISFSQYVCDLMYDVNWFDRKINQEQLCGFWKHVSLSGFFPSC